MIDQEYGMRLVNKLIELTVGKKIIWMTLPQYFESNDNEPLRKIVIANNKYAYSPFEAKKVFLINEYRSYCTEINGGIITLFSKDRGKDIKLDMALQVSPTQYLQDVYGDEELQENLKELMFKISAESNDGLKFIDAILKL